MSDHPVTSADDQMPDPALFWRWVGKAIRRYVGWILVAGGALAILIGYLGVSRQALVAKQLPYLISGGIFGLALVALGTFYLATEELRHDSGRLDRLERMVAELHGVLLARSDAPVPATVTAGGFVDPTADRSPNGRARSATLVALPEGHRFHLASCSMVAGKAGAQPVSETAIRRRHLEPCDLCNPAAATASASI
jgi:hypothetical protein